MWTARAAALVVSEERSLRRQRRAPQGAPGSSGCVEHKEATRAQHRVRRPPRPRMSEAVIAGNLEFPPFWLCHYPSETVGQPPSTAICVQYAFLFWRIVARTLRILGFGADVERKAKFSMETIKGLCTYSLRIIAPPRNPGTMPPYHPMVRGLCHDSTPFLLSARGVGTAVVMCDAARRLAQPRRNPSQPKRTRSNEPKPFAGLTTKPPCALCAREAAHPQPA